MEEKIMGRILRKEKVGMLDFAGAHKFLTFTGCVLSGISAVFALMPFVYIWRVIRTIIRSSPGVPDGAVLIHYGWMAVLFALLSMGIYFAALMCTHLSAFRTARNMKVIALHHLTKLPIGYFQIKGSGKLRRVIDDGAGMTETYLAHQLPDLTGAFVTPVAVLILLFVFDWRFGLVSLLPMAIGVAFLSRMMGPGLEEKMKAYQNALDDMNNQAVEYVRGIPVVKTFQQSVFSFKNFHASIMRYKKWAVDYTLSLRIPMCNYTVSINAIFIFLIVAGLLLLRVGTTTGNIDSVLDLVFYFLFTPVCVSMMNKIMHSSEATMKAKDATSRILEILNEQPLNEPANPRKPKRHDITFDQVTYFYEDSKRPAVDQVSFKMKEGSVTALVGTSGGGKSTIASLIPRFFDVTGGNIKIGGVDIREMKTEELMKDVAFVFQNSHLFKDTILNNIKAAKADASLEDVKRAVKAAQCQDIIDKMPQGLDTVVGTKGIYLSGGEAQRIALARAALKNAPIILLDEATAFADPDNEYQIQKTFEEITKGKTVLMIAHRLSTIKNADRILVLTDGKIREEGKHEELLKQEGIYADMWKEYESAAAWKVEKEAVS